MRAREQKACIDGARVTSLMYIHSEVVPDDREQVRGGVER